MPAQGNALGKPANHPSTTKIVQALKGRGSDDQSQINRSSNAIPWRLKQCSKFILKRQPSVMLFLVFNVPLYIVEVRLTYGKRTVPSLPVEVGIIWARVLRPL